MHNIELPEPPPFPPGTPVPERWDWGTPLGDELERIHRLAVLHELCPDCDDGPGAPSRREWLSRLAEADPDPPGTLPSGTLWTPEGEVASFVHGEFRVDDRPAFESWAASEFTVVGRAYAHVVMVADEVWPRGLFWFEDDRLHLETSSCRRYNHLEAVFEHVWPPVFREGRIIAPLDDRLDEPFRPTWPEPPAEASVFNRLQRRRVRRS